MIMRYWGIFQCLTVLAQESEDLRLLHVGWRQMKQVSCWLCRFTWYIGVEGGNMLITEGSNLPHKIRWKEIEEKSHWQQNIPIRHEHLKITGWKQRSEMKEAYFYNWSIWQVYTSNYNLFPIVTNVVIISLATFNNDVKRMTCITKEDIFSMWVYSPQKQLA